MLNKLAYSPYNAHRNKVVHNARKSSDQIANCVNKFLQDHSLTRCDDIFSSRKCATYVNNALGHTSFIDYMVVSITMTM